MSLVLLSCDHSIQMRSGCVTGKRRTDWRTMLLAAAGGAAIALPLGIYAGRQSPTVQKAADEQRADPSSGRSTRDVYAPGFRNDPYVIEQQLRVVRTLEQACRETRRHCKEAAQARLRLEETAAGR